MEEVTETAADARRRNTAKAVSQVNQPNNQYRCALNLMCLLCKKQRGTINKKLSCRWQTAWRICANAMTYLAAWPNQCH